MKYYKQIIFLLLINFSSRGYSQALTEPFMNLTKNTNTSYNPYKNYPIYKGNDLGLEYSPKKSIIKIWSPSAEEVKINLYQEAIKGIKLDEISAKKDIEGTWKAILKKDQKGKFYTIQVKIKNKWLNETVDPYAKAVGTNGLRAQIINLQETNPKDWEKDKKPALKNPTDAIIYEMHIRDFSIAENSGIKQKGKFIGLTESNTKGPNNVATGLDHLKELGITHVHILPFFDFNSIDESSNLPAYNWGYDPLNYNTPEGSYATDTKDPKTRIKELKQLIQTLHKNNIGVIMDVVYNHTAETENSNFNQLVPGYYYRQWKKNQTFSNGSACGNETASDRAMMRKFMIESVTYWAKEFHIDGFRFDLMGLHDIETMNQLSTTLHTYDPTLLLYGEGWTAKDTPLPESNRAIKTNVSKFSNIAVFNDDLRDAIKGSVFEEKSIGFANGANDMLEAIKIGIVAEGIHPQVNYTKNKYTKQSYTKNPSDIINYVSCHDNHTLYDKLKISRSDASEREIFAMQKLANTIILTSQGIPFIYSGDEMKRTKGGEDNSYNKPDAINQIDWKLKTDNANMVKYIADLIQLRKNHPAFRMTTNANIQKHIKFEESNDNQILTYQIINHANGDKWKNIKIIFNGSDQEKTIPIIEGTWYSAMRDGYFNEKIEITEKINIQPYSTTILYQE